MRDDRRGGAGAGRRNRPDAARAAPDDHPGRSRRAQRPSVPGATRAGRHGRLPRPTALNGPSHHTRETHSGALAAALRTRRTRPSRPPPRPSRPTSSKPPLNNLRGSGVVAAAGMGGRGVVRVGLPGRSGSGACPNLLQKRPATGSAARRSAEYQRFSSGAPARSGPLQQIWTNGAATGPGGPPRVGRRPRRAPRSAGRARGSVRRGRHRARGDVLLGAPGCRDVHFALESAVPTVILECEMHLSRAECTSRRRGGRSRSSRAAATAPPAPPRARPPAPL